jgi:DNA-binding transcriptional regulator YiaG
MSLLSGRLAAFCQPPVAFDTTGNVTPRQIIQLRKALGLTQQQLADLIAANRPTVARWEAGKHQPRGGYLKALKELQEKVRKKPK